MAHGVKLVDRLRELVEHAQRGGAPAPWVDETSDALVGALLELAELRRTGGDPRRRRTLDKAARAARIVGAMRGAGHTHAEAVAAVRERLGVSRSRAYELLAASGDRPDDGMVG